MQLERLKTDVLNLLKCKNIMKNKIITLLLGILAMTAINAQNDCSKFYPLKEGTKFQITSYGKKDKLAAVIDYMVNESSGNAATLSYQMYDEKGKLMLTSEYGMKCENDGISIDFKSLAAPGILNQYKDMEVDIKGTNLILPNSLNVGQTLPDADMFMTVNIVPIALKLSAKIFNRKVEGKETITTSAGTFECFVTTYNHESKMGIKFSGTAKQWLALGIGLVQQIDYNKKGEIISKSVLTKFEK